jgi:hypothetical protein
MDAMDEGQDRDIRSSDSATFTEVRAEVAIGNAQSLIADALTDPTLTTATLQGIADALQKVQDELRDQKTSWIGVRADLKAPAYHLHDETAVPMSVAAEPVQTRFGGDTAGFGWTVTYRCPQCGAIVRMDADVALGTQTRPDQAGVNEIGWFHGDGPGVP